MLASVCSSLSTELSAMLGVWGDCLICTAVLPTISLV